MLGVCCETALAGRLAENMPAPGVSSEEQDSEEASNSAKTSMGQNTTYQDDASSLPCEFSWY
jgi:hypothetical protein